MKLKMMDSILRILEWDSRYFHTRIAALQSKKLSRRLLDRVIGQCGQANINCLYFLCSTEDIQSIRSAERGGFQLLDIRIQFCEKLSCLRFAQTLSESHGVVLRKAVSGDIPVLRRLAKRLHWRGRFLDDPGFARTPAKNFYAEWIENSVLGRFDQAVFVATRYKQIVGYVSCAQVSRTSGRIGLVGVVPSLQGQGVGERLLSRSLEWFREQSLRSVYIVTSGNNIPAQRFYQRCGFTIDRVDLWYHKWFS